MEEASKSPFRLLLETEGFDSQASFELPSPRLVENSQAPTPELFYVDLEERESRSEFGPLYMQSCEPLTPSKPFLTPQAASGCMPLSLQAHLESVHIRLRKRSTPLSQLLYRTAKPDSHNLRQGRELSKDAHFTTFTPVGTGKKRLTPVVKGRPMGQEKAVRASEPRKPMWSPHRESPGRVVRVFAAPTKSYEVKLKQKGENGVAKIKGPELRAEPIKMIPKLSDKLKRRLK